MGLGPTQMGSCPGCVCRKKTGLWCPPRESLAPGTSREASSATSSTRRSYKASRGVLAETSARTSASPLSHASLRWRMSLAISKYMIAKAIALPRANATVGQMAIRQAAEDPCDLCFLKNIANTANGMDKWPFAVAIYLVAQTVDLYIHHVGSGVNAHAPHAIQNHGASHDPSGITNQVLQQRELLRCQLKGLLPSAGIDRKSV